MRRIVCFVLIFSAAMFWMSSAAVAQRASVQQMEAELAACPQKISALKGDIAAAKEAIEKQKPVVAAARLNAENYTPENFPGRPDLVREAQNTLAAEMGFLSGLEQRLKDERAALSSLEARCSKLKSDLAAAKAKAAEEKAARRAEEQRKTDEARRKAEEDARKQREAKARCEKHRKNIQARRAQLTKARDTAAKSVQDTLYTLSGMQMALVLMNRMELDTQINRGKLQTLITIAEGMNSDVKQTLIDAAMDKYASMAKTFGTGAVTAMTGVKTLEQIRRYERTQNLCIKTGNMYDDAEASRILKGQFKADDGQVDYAIGMICDQWAGENAAKRAADLSSSWANLQKATEALKTAQDKLAAFEKEQKDAKPHPDCEDQKTPEGSEKPAKPKDRAGQATDTPADKPADPGQASGFRRFAETETVTLSGRGKGKTRSIAFPEGRLKIRIQHETEAKNAYFSLNIRTDRTGDGTACNNILEGCGLVFQAGYDDVKRLDTTVTFDRHYYGGETHFTLNAPGKWTLTVTPEPYRKYSIAGTVTANGRPVEGALVKAANLRDESFTARTNRHGYYEITVWGDVGYTVTAAKEGYRTGRASVDAVELWKKKYPSAPAKRDIELSRQP